MDKDRRNALRKVVTDCRRILEEVVGEMLEGRYGITPHKITDATQMQHLSVDDREYREQLLVYLHHIQASGFSQDDAVVQLIREVAFTHLNRFCAYKMMEVRKIIRESVSRGYESNNVKFYLTEHPEDEQLFNTGQQDVAYRHFLEWLGGTLSEEIGVLFSPHDPANRLLPPQRLLDRVLELINSEELKDIWAEDETIGWIYQYFTPKELRDQARKESQAPRNSYELAFRNQFYTPSYVVQFLTDNTLGRIWYEMRQGETSLKELCHYLVCRPNEVFLVEGEEPPEEIQADESLSQQDLLQQPVCIPYRKLKDPREIRVLDPACGSGHFLLYCFTLLLAIYEEAWDFCPEILCDLRDSGVSKEAFMQQVPGLILAHNLHGIDIDIRATQIAALALWLRAQRAYQEMGLKKNRPKITKSNIVCAEPMPGEENLLEEFIVELQPKVLGQLLKAVFEKMKLAREAGSLLKIEDEIQDIIIEARNQWKALPKVEQLTLSPDFNAPRLEQPNIFDVTEISDEEFWNEAENRLIESLRKYAEQAIEDQYLQRQLFSNDAVRGFAFIDICRKQFDAVLMNPPFGLFFKEHFSWLKSKYSDSYVDIYSSFLARGMQLSQGKVGVISPRSFLITPKLARHREKYILQSLNVLLDLGEGVMDDATVLSCAYILDSIKLFENSIFLAFDRKLLEDKSKNLDKAVVFLDNNNIYLSDKREIERLQKTPILYSLSSSILQTISSNKQLKDGVLIARSGLTTFNDFRFLRLRAEIDPKDIGELKIWEPIAKGGAFSVFYSDLPLLIRWSGSGNEIAEENQRVNGQTAQARQASSYYRRFGGTYSYRSRKDFGVRVLPAGCIIGNKGPAVLPDAAFSAEFAIGLLNSRFIKTLIKLQANDSQYDTGIIERIPWVQFSQEKIHRIEFLIRQSVEKIRSISIHEENNSLFTVLPYGDSLSEIADVWSKSISEVQLTIESSITEINDVVDSVYKVNSASFENSVGSLEDEKSKNDKPNNADDDDEEENSQTLISLGEVSSNYLSFVVGCIFGRWDIRFVSNRSLAPELSNLFDSLPICFPATLVEPQGLPATKCNIVSQEWLLERFNTNTLPPAESVQNPAIINDSEYPITVDWDGILVDDPDHPDDIIRRIRNVLEVIWSDNTDAIEQEACEILGVKDLRDYFRKPSNGGFWQDHIKRYSKSRRKAPIYWLLQSSKKNYAIWLYYHRLDKDLLFKAQTQYIEPKLNLENNKLNQLNSQRAGLSGSDLKKLEKTIEKQDSFVSELQDFLDKLKRAANLNLEPDLNDGVVLNIAPLWELVPWGEAKKYWQELTQGKYEWSSISKQLQAKQRG
jgi:hypothetical protein